MYSAADVLEQKGAMLLVKNYYFKGNILISYPRLAHLNLSSKVPVGIILESGGQSGEILCRSILQNIHKVYIVRIDEFKYRPVNANQCNEIVYKTKLINRLNNYFQTLIKIYIKENQLIEFKCTHYLL